MEKLMSYRNGTYVAFHAQGTSDQTASDIKYYRTLQMWSSNSAISFSFVDSHEKTAAVRDSSLRSTLRTRLLERLRNSKNLLLIVTATTRLDTDWVPFEIEQAIHTYRIPVIAAYPGFSCVFEPTELRHLWPRPLGEAIEGGRVGAIHIPFRREALLDAIQQFNPLKFPLGNGLGVYSYETQRAWGYVS